MRRRRMVQASGIVTFQDLLEAYLQSLAAKASYSRTVRVCRPWLLTLTELPTRAQILARQEAICPAGRGPLAAKANKELTVLRAAIRRGIYHGTWPYGDPTVGIRKCKTRIRERVAYHLELRALLDWFARPQDPTDLRDRALFGAALLSGCRPSEIRTAKLADIVPYGDMGRWLKPMTKNGTPQELPLPRQAMEWIAAWLQVRHTYAQNRGGSIEQNPYLFPGQDPGTCLSDCGMRVRWAILRTRCRMPGLWNYDLRRTLSTYVHEMGYSFKYVKEILHHYEAEPSDHYIHPPFDSLATVVQAYADWLMTLKGADYAPPRRPVAADWLRATPGDRRHASGDPRLSSLSAPTADVSDREAIGAAAHG